MTNISEALTSILPENRIRAKYIDRVSFASDAGFYHLVPQAVVQPVDEKEIAALFRFSHEQQIPLVFRAGGTSLSGQSITDGILVDLSQHWNRVTVEENGSRVRVQPGITGAMVNIFLKKFQRKIGPDPSSINAAMMGGILSNNASGMCCGVALNSYHTTRAIRFILPDGQIFDTSQPDDYQRFEKENTSLFQTLADLKKQIENNPTLFEKIRKKYQSKNTVGYSLNAFIDHQHPLDIFAHLLIGAEGTLAFIAEAVLETVPDYPCKSTGLLYYPTIFDACQAIIPLTEAGALMLELMDRASLRSVENNRGMPPIVKTLPEGAAALLVEFQESTPEALHERVSQFLKMAAQMLLITPPAFSEDPGEQAFLWNVRKGLFPAVGAVRASGETVILEDIAFPVAQLGNAIIDLQQLFLKHHYPNGIIFGHAKDGNIHFVVTQSFNSPEEVARYEAFMEDVVALVVEKYDGALKAEHGTGRNMAPFVETEWGGDAYAIMETLKNAVDPHHLLNPGVIINTDKKAHLKNLKTLPSVEAEVDKCIECGFCEHKCPSRDLTATPRRRIVVRRALKNLAAAGDRTNHDLLLRQFQYDGLDTCAVDGLCATACPVDINTGDLVKRLRRENHSQFANWAALKVAQNFGFTTGLARTALKTGNFFNTIFGKKTMTRLTGTLRKVIPAVPRWAPQLSAPPDLSVVKKQKNVASSGGSIVYFPSCISRMMGTYEGEQKDIIQTFLSICEKTNVGVIVPQHINSVCCSQIFSSKGYSAASQLMAARVVTQLWEASSQGQFPIVTDVSSCTYTFKHLRPLLEPALQAQFDKMQFQDSVEFLHKMVLPNHQPEQKKGKVVLHPVCSLQKMGTQQQFVDIARAFADTVTVPVNAGCCGMAGDRGFILPELTASATLPEAEEVRQQHFDGYYSSTKTCEMALSEAVQANYLSIMYLVDKGL